MRFRKALQARDVHLVASRSHSHPQAQVGICFILSVGHFAGQERQVSLVQPVSPDTRTKGRLELGKISLPAFTSNGEWHYEKGPAAIFFADGNRRAAFSKSYCLIRAFNIGRALGVKING